MTNDTETGTKADRPGARAGERVRVFVTGLTRGRPLAWLLVAGCVLVTLAFLKWESEPFVWAPWVWAAAAGVAMWRVAESSAGRALCFNLAFTAAVFGGIEVWIASQEVPYRFEYADGYYNSHPILGYAPAASERSRSRRYYGEEVIYDVHYTIDEQGMRATPAGGPDSDVVLLFGGSYAFGEGIEDEEVMAHLVGARSGGRYRVLNFGFHAYGPHQMLAAVEEGLVEERSTKPPTAAIYLAISDHVARAAGLRSYGRRGPRYLKTESGEPQRNGRLKDGPPRARWPERQLHKSLLYDSLVDTVPKLTEADYELYCAIVSRAKGLLAERYPEMAFHVLLWSDNETFLAKAECLAEVGISLHPITDILPDFGTRETDYRIGPRDGHPNADANERTATYVLKEILESE